MKIALKLLALLFFSIPTILLAQTSTVNTCGKALGYNDYWSWIALLISSVLLIVMVIVKFCKKSYIDKFILEKNASLITTSNNPTPEPPKSTSRLILLLSGLTAIFISPFTPTILVLYLPNLWQSHRTSRPIKLPYTTRNRCNTLRC